MTDSNPYQSPEGTSAPQSGGKKPRRILATLIGATAGFVAHVYRGLAGVFGPPAASSPDPDALLGSSYLVFLTLLVLCVGGGALLFRRLALSAGFTRMLLMGIAGGCLGFLAGVAVVAASGPISPHGGGVWAGMVFTACAILGVIVGAAVGLLWKVK